MEVHQHTHTLRDLEVDPTGGGWCNTVQDCGGRAMNRNGSSLHFPPQTTFSGLLDLNYSFNPNFYNWHKVFIYYCDGASFMADVEHPVNNIRFRGARIFKVMMEEMISKGMNNAHNAILAGSSAGGLATTLHCDRFRELFPNTTTVKCISDSGYFIHGNVEGLPAVQGKADYFAQVIATHDIAKSLPTSCTKKMDPSLCLYPENFVGDINTPLFLIESAFDSVQIESSLVPAVGGQAAWIQCLRNLTLCNSTELEIMRGFRALFIEKLVKLDPNPSRGMFVHSFFRHGHLLLRGGWTCSSVYGNNILANKTIGQAVSDWYFDGNPFQMIDTQNSNPRGSPTQDYDILDQKCLATLSLNLTATSHAHHQLILSALCVSLLQIFIPLIFY
ncbi:hypothetical protein C2S53_000201 [Perilla frutescens var. hirtella]|uniref:Pectin acetylesterase n=1 Tax=Perilla frutescens var. hirtella TaxID=608512 RepID=A0AAD4P906_PERFH|nr:hypothetical protein C2S53_000201 [Perilla frutescens var. hirtella]